MWSKGVTRVVLNLSFLARLLMSSCGCSLAPIASAKTETDRGNEPKWQKRANKTLQLLSAVCRAACGAGIRIQAQTWPVPAGEAPYSRGRRHLQLNVAPKLPMCRLISESACNLWQLAAGGMPQLCMLTGNGLGQAGARCDGEMMGWALSLSLFHCALISSVAFFFSVPVSGL